MSDQDTTKPERKPYDIWKDFAETLLWEKGHLDDSSYQALLRGGSLEVPSGEVVAWIVAKKQAGGFPPYEHKLQKQAKRAYSFAESAAHFEPKSANYAKQAKAKYSPEKLQMFAGNWSAVVSSVWLADRSFIDPSQGSLEHFIDTLYDPGEFVLVFHKFKSQGQYLRKAGHGNYIAGASERDRSRSCGKIPTFGGQDGVWYLAQPVDGKWHPNPRSEGCKMSRRSEESVRRFRYMILESDEAKATWWLGALVQLPLKIAAIYTSGGKSIHAVVRVDAKSKADWDDMRKKALKLLVPLGADPASITAVRLSRAPFCTRRGQVQKLLYINDQPAALPIIKAPVQRNVVDYWSNMYPKVMAGTADEDEKNHLRFTLAHYANGSDELSKLLAEGWPAK